MLSYQVCDMLDLFSIKTDRFKQIIKPTNIRQEIVQNLFDVIIEPCKLKKLKLEYCVEDRVPDYIKLDSQRIRQVFMNLLQNALKFTYTGSIQFTVDYDPLSKHIIGKVKDTGTGISEEQ
jgi:signal transduction histidine kinase